MIKRSVLGMLLFSVILCFPLGEAGINVSAGPLLVVLDDEFVPETCTTPSVDGICLAGYSHGDSDAIGDDTVDVYQNWRAVRVELRAREVPLVGEVIAPLLPDESVVINSGDLRARQPVVAAFAEAHDELQRQTPALPLATDVNETGIWLHRPDGSSEWLTFTNRTIVNYTHVNVPWMIHGVRSDTDARYAGGEWCMTYRPEAALVLDACRRIRPLGLHETLPASLPEVRVGVEVHRVEARANPPMGNGTNRPEDLVAASVTPPSSWAEPDRERPSARDAPAHGTQVAPPARARDPTPPEAVLQDVVSMSQHAPRSDTSDAVSPLLVVAAAATAFLAYPLWALYRRLTRHDLLTQTTRQRLLDLVAAEPGIALTAAARALGVQHRAVDYHAHLLQQAGCLVVERHRGHVRLFAAGARPPGARDDPARAALLSPTARRLLLALARARVATRGELARAAGLPATTTNWHVRRLKDVGLVEESADARGPTLLRLTPARREAVVDVLLGFEPARPPARAG